MTANEELEREKTHLDVTVVAVSEMLKTERVSFP